MRARDARHERGSRTPARADELEAPSAPHPLLALQASAGNRAAVRWVEDDHTAGSRPPSVQRDELEWSEDGGSGEAEELQTRPRPRTRAQARAMVDAHVEPKDCFIELESSSAGWRAIPGTGCAHWVAHQRGAPTGTARVCDAGFKYRVTDLLATLTQRSADLQGARVGDVWSAGGSSHVGIVRAVNREDGGTRVVSVSVENDSSASGGVVTQTKTDGSIYGG